MTTDQTSKPIHRRIYETIRDSVNIRLVETEKALEFLAGCERILDVGCGTGNFIERDPRRIEGVDLNEDCVAICNRKGLRAQLGDALNLPFQDATFDGVYCSHVIHVFHSAQAFRLMAELCRVVKPGGVVVLATVPLHKRFYFEPADARPYPPIAIRNMFAVARSDTETAPTFKGMTSAREVGLWFRRPALIEFVGHRGRSFDGFGALLNQIQYRLLLRKYWTFNGYLMALRVEGGEAAGG